MNCELLKAIGQWPFDPELTYITDLLKGFDLRASWHPDLPLVIVNYHQFADKFSSLANECRALVLDTAKKEVVARSFPRFFNQGELPASKFNWNDFKAYLKYDGSLFVLFYYNGEWMVTTRGSFAFGVLSEECGLTWENAFFLSGIDDFGFEQLDKDFAYSFEFCSPWNQVVAYHPTPKVILLAAFNKAGEEMDEDNLRRAAHAMKVEYAQPVASTPEEVEALMQSHCNDIEFEGFVLKDSNGLRMKVKNAAYVRAHRVMTSNQRDNLLEILLNGEQEEVLNYLPELKEDFDKLDKSLTDLFIRLNNFYLDNREKGQKEFALAVMNEWKDYQAILFSARKKGILPSELRYEDPNFLLNCLEDKF